MSDGLIVLALIHLIGLGRDSYKYKRKTWMGMVTGRVLASLIYLGLKLA
jgi:hypothetical protein